VGAFSNPHFEHRLLNGAAHSLQNFNPSWFSAPQFEHRIGLPVLGLFQKSFNAAPGLCGLALDD
jgi:hypothetical protein